MAHQMLYVNVIGQSLMFVGALEKHYINDLVSQANECGDEIISDVEKNEIVQIVEKMIKTTK